MCARSCVTVGAEMTYGPVAVFVDVSGIAVENVGSCQGSTVRLNDVFVDKPVGPDAIRVTVVEETAVFLGIVRTPVAVLRYDDNVEGFTDHVMAPVYVVV